MANRRTFALIASAAVMLTYLLVPLGPAAASHGTAGANCPTGIESVMIVLTNSGPVLVDEGTSAPPIVYGDSILVGGELFADPATDPGADVSDEAVEVKATDVGTNTPHVYPMQTGSGEDAGLFVDEVTPFASARWVSSWTGTDPCALTVSSAESIFLGVKVRIHIERSHVRPPAGFRFTIRGGVAPNHAGKVVTMQWKKVGSPVVRTDTLTLDSSSRYFKRFVSNTPGSQWDFRTIYDRQDDEHQGNRSRWVRVTIT